MELLIHSLSGIFNGKNFIKGPVSLLIDKGKIQEIVYDKISISADTKIDGTDRIVSMPFHDAHTHLIFGGERFFELGMKLEGKSYSEILSQGGGIKYTTTESRNATDEELKSLLLKRLDIMLSHGSLDVEAKSGYGLSTGEELRQLRLLNEVDKIHPVKVHVTFGGAHVPPVNYSRKQYINDIIEEMLPAIVNENLATSTDVFCDRGAFTVDETRMIFDRSKELSLPVRVHAEELEYTGIGKIASEYYNALSVDHLLLAKKGDFEVYEKNNTVANFMPLAPIGLFTDNQPQGWNETNCVIGMGSDFNPNNWIVSMQTAIRMGVFRYRMTPTQAFKAATTGSYQAITGQTKKIIQVGEQANIIIINSKSIEEATAKIGQNLISHIIKNGEIILKNNHRIV